MSVLVTNYNYGAFVERALQSIATQTFQSLEIIAVDDGSTDHSIEVIERWAATSDLPFHLIAKPQNEGVGAALDDALAKARGRYVAILDADDEFYPNKIAIQVDRLERTNAVATYSRVDIVDEEGLAVLGLSSVPDTPPTGDVRRTLITNGTFAATNSALFRRVELSTAGFRRDLRLSQDYAMWLALSMLGNVDFLDETVGRVWQHGASIRAGRPVVKRQLYRADLLTGYWSNEDLRPALRRKLARVAWTLGRYRSRTGLGATLRSASACRLPMLPLYYTAGWLQGVLEVLSGKLRKRVRQPS